MNGLANYFLLFTYLPAGEAKRQPAGKLVFLVFSPRNCDSLHRFM